MKKTRKGLNSIPYICKLTSHVPQSIEWTLRYDHFLLSLTWSEKKLIVQKKSNKFFFIIKLRRQQIEYFRSVVYFQRYVRRCFVLWCMIFHLISLDRRNPENDITDAFSRIVDVNEMSIDNQSNMGCHYNHVSNFPHTDWL